MKTLLLAILSRCFCLTVVVALLQDAPNQALGRLRRPRGSADNHHGHS